MKASEQFIKAISKSNIKNLPSGTRLSSMLVIDRPDDGKIIRLCFDVVNPITDKTEMALVETPTEIQFSNYSGGTKKEHKTCFHISSYRGYIKTFLSSIKKDSEISFEVISFNNSDNLNSVGWVHHSLIGIVDNKEFLLDSYVGPDNFVSPIQWVAP